MKSSTCLLKLAASLREVINKPTKPCPSLPLPADGTMFAAAEDFIVGEVEVVEVEVENRSVPSFFKVRNRIVCKSKQHKGQSAKCRTQSILENTFSST